MQGQDVARDLARMVRGLDEAGIPHVVVGSLASSFHAEPRTTQDIDIVIDPTPESLRHFVEGQPRSERQFRDVASMLAVNRDTLDHVYLDRWITSLGLTATWERANGLASD